jgi:hypothetical protein
MEKITRKHELIHFDVTSVYSSVYMVICKSHLEIRYLIP